MLTFQEFKHTIAPRIDEVWSEIYQGNPDLIGVAKEKTAIRNLKKIVDATLALSNKKGFHAMSLRDLVAKAEISKGGLYAYIKNKDDLALLIQKHGYELAICTLVDTVQDITAPQERLFTFIRSFIYLSEMMQPWFLFSYMEARSLGEAGRKQVIENEFNSDKLLADIIREGQVSGVFRNIDPDLSTAMIKAMIQDRYLKPWKYHKLGVDIDDFADNLCQAVAELLVNKQQAVKTN